MTISQKRRSRRRPPAQRHTAGTSRSSRSIAVIAAALSLARETLQPIRLTERTENVPAAEFAGVEVDDPVAPSPAASIGDATISSVGHCPSSIVASNRDQQFRQNGKRRR